MGDTGATGRERPGTGGQADKPEEPEYIGIQEGHFPPATLANTSFAHLREGPVPTTVRPIYRTGDEYKPISTPWIIPDLQMSMVNAGILDPEKIHWGDWDELTRSAYKDVLAQANQLGTSAVKAMAHMSANPTIAQIKAMMEAASKGSGSGRTVTLANPQDLQAVANQVAPDVMGRKFTQQELDDFVSSFHAAQRGGNPPQMDVAAEAKARSIDPTAATARDMTGVFNVVMRMMAGQSSQVPNTGTPQGLQ